MFAAASEDKKPVKAFEFAEASCDGVRRSDSAESREREVADCHGMCLLSWLALG
jgi:hypothetical protein